jgi:hypothetical protein
LRQKTKKIWRKVQGSRLKAKGERVKVKGKKDGLVDWV